MAQRKLWIAWQRLGKRRTTNTREKTNTNHPKSDEPLGPRQNGGGREAKGGTSIAQRKALDRLAATRKTTNPEHTRKRTQTTNRKSDEPLDPRQNGGGREAKGGTSMVQRKLWIAWQRRGKPKGTKQHASHRRICSSNNNNNKQNNNHHEFFLPFPNRHPPGDFQILPR